MAAAAEPRTGTEVACCGHTYTFVRTADMNPPIPERYWPGDSFQVDGDWQGSSCCECGSDLHALIGDES